MNTEMKKTVVYSTGDKILNIMKEQDMDIPELSLRCGHGEDNGSAPPEKRLRWARLHRTLPF